MRILVDGSALSLAIVESPDCEAWRAWAAQTSDQLEVTEIAVTQMRLRATAEGPDAAAAAHDLAWVYPVRRFSDQALEMAGRISRALEPFVALHVALAKTDPEVDAVATFDPTMAAAAELFGVPVISPGRGDGWWRLPDAEVQVRVGEVPAVEGEPSWIGLGSDAASAQRRAEQELALAEEEAAAEQAALQAALDAIRDRSDASMADTLARADARAGVLTAPAFEAAPETRHFTPEPVVVEPTEFVEVVPLERESTVGIGPVVTGSVVPVAGVAAGVSMAGAPLVESEARVDAGFDLEDTIPDGVLQAVPEAEPEAEPEVEPVVDAEPEVEPVLDAEPERIFDADPEPVFSSEPHRDPIDRIYSQDQEPEAITAENEIVIVDFEELRVAETVASQGDLDLIAAGPPEDPLESGPPAPEIPVRVSIRDLMGQQDQI